MSPQKYMDCLNIDLQGLGELLTHEIETWKAELEATKQNIFKLERTKTR